MMAWTDRHCRYLHRLAAPHALLFTEMVTSSALLHGPAERLLRFDLAEHPVALQLGGSDPADLSAAAATGAEAGFDEINLNVGCPSPRVKQGRFGACLMREPALVAECVAAMAAATDKAVTVKCRLGVDEHDNQPALEQFVSTVADAGCRTFYVHARKALLNGLSPAENRTVPPLEYERVYRLKERFPELEVVINGGIGTVEAVEGHLAEVDGVMIGRAAYHQPLMLGEMDRVIFGRVHEWERPPGRDKWERPPGRDGAIRESESRPGGRSHIEGGSRPGGRSHMFAVMEGYRGYMARELQGGARLADMTRHALGLFAGVPGARSYRRILSDARRLKANDLALVDEALAALSPRAETRAA